MVPCPCATDRTWWAVSTAMAAREKRQTPSAVEKAGAWKPVKTQSRFPPSPTLPWKSRKPREIPTFPPRRLLFVAVNENQGGASRLNQKPDRSRINKTGHLDLLPTAICWTLH